MGQIGISENGAVEFGKLEGYPAKLRPGKISVVEVRADELAAQYAGTAALRRGKT